MQTRTFLVAALAIAGCHHQSTGATTPAPQPDFKFGHPHAMASRIPASPGERHIWPTGWVFFQTDSDELSPASAQDLDTVVAWVKSHPAGRIVVEGHADIRGTDEYNLELSFKRGAVVADYLGAHGVARARIEIDPQGKRGASPEALPADRRVIIFATRP
jgi:outer membrane protein OmpA-like peptidoglycan-associated protein